MGLPHCVIINVSIILNEAKIWTVINMGYKGRAKFVTESVEIMEKTGGPQPTKELRNKMHFKLFSFPFHEMDIYLKWLHKPMKTRSLH